jgi:hypothetical protein
VPVGREPRVGLLLVERGHLPVRSMPASGDAETGEMLRACTSEPVLHAPW